MTGLGLPLKLKENVEFAVDVVRSWELFAQLGTASDELAQPSP
jgi:hypothetical protein